MRCTPFVTGGVLGWSGWLCVGEVALLNAAVIVEWEYPLAKRILCSCCKCLCRSW